MIIGKDKWVLREQMKDVIICGKVWVWCQGLVFFPVTSQFFLVDDILGRGWMTMDFLLEDLSLGRRGALKENFSLHLLLFSSVCSSK